MRCTCEGLKKAKGQGGCDSRLLHEARFEESKHVVKNENKQLYLNGN